MVTRLGASVVTPAERPVLLVHPITVMRRILRLNFEVDWLPVIEAATVSACLESLDRRHPGAVVLHPLVFNSEDAEAAVCDALRARGIPVLFISERAAHRRLTRAVPGASFCNRPDDIERVSAAVHTMLRGLTLPSTV